MGVGSTRHRIWRKGSVVALSLAACLTLAACGPLGDDDAEPTATKASLAQPTDGASATSTDVATDVPEETVEVTEVAASGTPTSASAPVSFDSTPDLEPITATTEAPAVSTPVFNDISTTTEVVSASPVAGDLATPIASPVATPQFDGPLPDGDGTQGAMPGGAETPEETPLLVQENADGSPATPGASPVALATSLNDLEIVEVTSCEPEDVPDVDLESTAYRTNSDVNIRFGPGADCDTLAISPLGGFMPVTILSGPVQRDGEDFVWVQVEVTGEIGWVVTEALEPIEP